jgi:hypothetical protein
MKKEKNMSQRFHGILMAGTSEIENLHLERLVSDPVVTEGGRFWVNKTTRAIKYSHEKADGSIEVLEITDRASLEAAVATLNASIAAVSGGSSTAIDAERAARVAAISALQTALADEVAARIAGDAAEATARTDGLAAEAARADAAIAGVQTSAASALATETAARIAGDQANATGAATIAAELDATQAGAGLGTDGAYVAKPDANYIAGATNLANATELLDVALKTENARAVGAEAALGSALANEAQLREAGDALLQSQLEAFVKTQIDLDNVADDQKLAAEAVLRIAGDTALKTEIDAIEASIGLDSEGKLIPIAGTNYMDDATTVFGAAVKLDQAIKSTSDSLAAEVAARVASGTALQGSVDAEKARAEGVEANLLAEINTIEAGVGLESNGAFVAPLGTTYLGEATSVKDAGVKLDAAVKAVADRTAVVETVTIPGIQTALTAEVNRATAAEAAEATRAQAAEAALQAAIGAETTRATGEEIRIEGKVDAETAARVAAVTGVQGQVDALLASSGSGAAALKTSLNSGRVNYAATEAKLEHIVVHNFGHDEFIPYVTVQGDDLVYRNDVMPIEPIDANSFKVILDVAAKIRVRVISTAALV